MNSHKTGTHQASFLTRVRAALAKTGMATPRPPAEANASDWRERAERVRAGAVQQWEELLARFTAELEAVAGVVHRAAPAAVSALVAKIARERNFSRIVTWNASALGLPGFMEALQAEGLQVEDDSPAFGGAVDAQTFTSLRQRLNRAEIGLTGVDYAVAESGSLVLFSGPGKGRLVSCLPIVHVAILRPGQLVGTLEDVGILFEESHHHLSPGDSPSAITFITGPSRTADIELRLTRGVHGPKELHVVVLDG